jgi:hypothetical protein
MFILPPYTPFETAQRELPGPRYLTEHEGLESRDDVCVLAFFDRQKLVARITQSRRVGDFSAFGKPGGYARKDAVFVLSSGRLVHDAG